jgi:hypothetical protein
MGSPAPNSGVQFFGGQKGQAAKLFEPGGIFEQMLAGGPSVALGQQTARSQEQILRSSASRGQEGSGLEARQVSDLGTKSAVAAEGNQLERLLALMQPAGSFSSNVGFLQGSGKF